MFENKKIFILGFARSGYEAAKFLIKRGNEVLINDGKDESESDRILYCFDGGNWNKIDTVESEIDTDGNLTDKVKSDDSMVVDIKRRG